MVGEERCFRVYDKTTDQLTEVTGKQALADALNVPVDQIADIFMLKVTFGEKVVMEVR